MMDKLIASAEYKKWLVSLKSKIRRSQIKAAVQVNTEMLRMYWELGKDIAEKNLDAKWGSGFFNRLSLDLKKEFPDMKGFSVSNLKYMKRFFLFYSGPCPIRHQLGDELQNHLFQDTKSAGDHWMADWPRTYRPHRAYMAYRQYAGPDDEKQDQRRRWAR